LETVLSHDSTRDNPYTKGIAEFVSRLQAKDIPAEVMQRIKLLILDSIGCSLYGQKLEWVQILQNTLASVDESRSASIWGSNKRLSLPHAVLSEWYPNSRF
jgi:2-methylcitrate dehydratase PrpD